ncbi:MAG: toll/interleukin-1 receptor domain-containing protein [Nitrospirae bacterium]|nr:toll/interleukin-1 receptor domain-containing protein [Nitrospirota bacterium]
MSWSNYFDNPPKTRRKIFYLILFLSPNAINSDWVNLERSTALFRDPTNSERRFIPVLIEDCKLPDALKRYRYGSI